MWTIGDIPFETLALALAVALALVIVFHWIRRYFLPLLQNRRTIRTLHAWLPRIEIVCWSVFAGATFIALMQANLLLAAILFVLMGVVGMGFWKDLFTGLYFRLAGRFLPGDPVQFDAAVGHVVRARSRDVELITADGGRAWVPYSRIAREVIGQRSTTAKLPGRTITVDLPGIDADEARSMIRQLLLRDPWVATTRPISIQSHGGPTYSIDLHLVDPEAMDGVQALLLKEFGTPERASEAR